MITYKIGQSEAHVYRSNELPTSLPIPRRRSHTTNVKTPTLVILREFVSDHLVNSSPLRLSGAGSHVTLLDRLGRCAGGESDGGAESVHGGDFIFIGLRSAAIGVRGLLAGYIHC